MKSSETKNMLASNLRTGEIAFIGMDKVKVIDATEKAIEIKWQDGETEWLPKCAIKVVGRRVRILSWFMASIDFSATVPNDWVA